MLQNTIKILESAGWSDKYVFDPEKEVEILKKENFIITKSFFEFYEKYGNLKFYLEDVKGSQRSIGFIIEDALWIAFSEVIIDDYPKIIGCHNLTLIGQINKSSVLTIDDEGKIYSLYDGSVIKLGNNAEEALDNLCNVGWAELREQGEYPIPDWW